MGCVSQWRAYAIGHMDRQTIQLIILIVARFIQQENRAPTPDEVWAEITAAAGT